MKYFVILALISLSVHSKDECRGGEGSFYTNPDGSLGGFVEKGVLIKGRPYIDPASEVCDNVKIDGAASIKRSKLSDNVLITGPVIIEESNIFQFAKISGKAVIHKAVICQMSVIEGIKVIDSKYYCQTEDPEPKDPGEAGLTTVLGIDSDNDDVRDDVEIFINVNLPNTKLKDRAQERINSKFFASILFKEFEHYNNKVILKVLEEAKQDLMSCFAISLRSDIFGEMNNTKERINRMIEINGLNHGKVLPLTKTCRSFEEIQKSVAEVEKRKK